MARAVGAQVFAWNYFKKADVPMPKMEWNAKHIAHRLVRGQSVLRINRQTTRGRGQVMRAAFHVATLSVAADKSDAAKRRFAMRRLKGMEGFGRSFRLKNGAQLPVHPAAPASTSPMSKVAALFSPRGTVQPSVSPPPVRDGGTGWSPSEAPPSSGVESIIRQLPPSSSISNCSVSVASMKRGGKGSVHMPKPSPRNAEFVGTEETQTLMRQKVGRWLRADSHGLAAKTAPAERPRSAGAFGRAAALASGSQRFFSGWLRVLKGQKEEDMRERSRRVRTKLRVAGLFAQMANNGEGIRSRYGESSVAQLFAVSRKVLIELPVTAALTAASTATAAATAVVSRGASLRRLGSHRRSDSPSASPSAWPTRGPPEPDEVAQFEESGSDMVSVSPTLAPPPRKSAVKHSRAGNAPAPAPVTVARAPRGSGETASSRMRKSVQISTTFRPGVDEHKRPGSRDAAARRVGAPGAAPPGAARRGGAPGAARRGGAPGAAPAAAPGAARRATAAAPGAADCVLSAVDELEMTDLN